MPYKIHLENDEPAPGTHIVTESAPLFIVEIKEEAKAALQGLWNAGAKNIYAVGYDA